MGCSQSLAAAATRVSPPIGWTVASCRKSGEMRKAERPDRLGRSGRSDGSLFRRLVTASITGSPESSRSSPRSRCLTRCQHRAGQQCDTSSPCRASISKACCPPTDGWPATIRSPADSTSPPDISPPTPKRSRRRSISPSPPKARHRGSTISASTRPGCSSSGRTLPMDSSCC